MQDWGGVVLRPDAMAAHPGAGTVFSPFKQDTTYFAPSTKDFMINLAVDDLDGILASCAQHGVEANVMPGRIQRQLRPHHRSRRHADRALAAEADVVPSEQGIVAFRRARSPSAP